MGDNFNYRNAWVLVGKVDSAGYAAGQVSDPENVDYASNTVVSGALVLPVIDTGGLGVTRAVYTEKSGGVIRQNVDAGVESVSSFPLTFGRHASALGALSSNVATANVDTVGTVGTVQHGGLDVAPGTLNNVFVAVLHQRSEYASGSFTAGRWAMKLYGMGQLAPTDYATNQNTGDNPFPSVWNFTAAKTTKAIWGQLWSALSLGYDNNETFMHLMTGRDPFAIATAWMDGTDTTFTPPYLPLYSDVAITGRNLIYKNGTRTAVTSWSTSTGLVTLAAAGTAGDKWVLVYPSDYVAA